MNNDQVLDALRRFPTGNLCNAHPNVQAIDASIAPIFDGAAIVGPAKTVKISPGQNAAIHRAVHTATPGDVLVVESAGDKSFGPFGDILATCCRNQEITGLIIDSTIRDVAEIRNMRFPVYCLGANPTATSKSEPGEIDKEIRCGGVRVRPGDLIAGDDDGVVVIPYEIARHVVDLASQVAGRERAIMARLASGRTTYEVFELGS